MINHCVRLAEFNDLPQLQNLDSWPQCHIWQQKIANSEVIVLEHNGKVIGLLRYSILWTTVPFIGLITIEETYRKRGYSKILLDYTKQHLRHQGFIALLSSSQTNEPQPQAWHRKMGFTSNGIIENIADDDIGEIVYRMLL